MKKMVAALLLIGIAALGIMNLNLNRRIDNLEVTVQALNNFLISDIRGLYSMQQDISDKLDDMHEQAAQSARLSFDEAILIKGYHEDKSSADADISFGLKQFGAEDEVKVSARGTSGKTFEAAAARSGSGRFAASMTLPVQDNYILSFTASGESNISGELTKLNLADELCQRFIYSLGAGQTNSPDQQQGIITLHPELANNTQGNAALEIKELSVVVESDNTTVGAWDLSPYLQNDSNSQMINGYSEELQNLVGFTMPFGSSAKARLVITDNMGVRYEQTDAVYIGSSPNSGVGGGVSYSYAPPRISEDGEYGDGYIHIARAQSN